MNKIEITKQDLHLILKEYDEDNYESQPLSAKSFVDQIFYEYHRKRLNPEDAGNSVCDSPSCGNK